MSRDQTVFSPKGTTGASGASPYELSEARISANTNDFMGYTTHNYNQGPKEILYNP